MIITYPIELLHDATVKMAQNDIGRMLVVNRNDSGPILGYLGRSSIVTMRLKRYEEKHTRKKSELLRMFT